MDVLVVVDMQEATLLGKAKQDLSLVVARINRLAERVRDRGGCVVLVQHDGAPGDAFAPHAPGWEILKLIKRDPSDRVVRKTLNDAFFDTSLESQLRQLGAERVLICGWATDLCVDSTVRSAAALGFEVVVVGDCHTVADRPHLNSGQVIEHHHWVWANLFGPHAVTIADEEDLLP